MKPYGHRPVKNPDKADLRADGGQSCRIKIRSNNRSAARRSQHKGARRAAVLKTTTSTHTERLSDGSAYQLKGIELTLSDGESYTVECDGESVEVYLHDHEGGETSEASGSWDQRERMTRGLWPSLCLDDVDIINRALREAL